MKIEQPPSFQSRNYTAQENTIQKSTAPKSGDLQEVLFETIEEFESQNKKYAQGGDLTSISKLILPQPVHILFAESDSVKADFEAKIAQEKEQVNQEIDNFLKEIILIMEKVKETMDTKIDTYRDNFLKYYQGFSEKVANFVKMSTQMVAASESMQSYQHMRKSLAGGDPLSREIGIFMRKKEQANQIEQLFRNIKAKYKSTNLDIMKDTIDRSLS